MNAAAVQVDAAWTASSAAGGHSYAHVVCFDAVSVRQADPNIGEPEHEIDLEAAAQTLLEAGNIGEPASSSVATGSPFGI